jgi:hypothetical protein
MRLLLTCSLFLACSDKSGSGSDDGGTGGEEGSDGADGADGADGGAEGADGGGDTAAPNGDPEFYCPGDPTGVCDNADGTFKVGAGKVEITPTCFESWVDLDADAELDDEESFLDCGCDRLCEGDEGWPGADEGEADGEFQAVWLAGFQNNRPAVGVRDPLWARAIVFDKGETRVALVELDVVGWFYEQVLETRLMAEAEGLGIDHVVVASTHNHEGPDTMGIWGQRETVTGFDPEYAAHVRQQSVEALRLAVADLREVGTFKVGSVDVSSYHDVGVLNLLQDARDPFIVDEQMGGAIFLDTAGETIATLAHFGNHPEATADENAWITSDFSHALREGLESGVTWGDGSTRPGYGGTAIFINGTVGGMMTPLGITIYTPDGGAYRDYSFERTDALGKVKAEMAMDAIDGGEEVVDPELKVARRTFFLPVENWGFQAMFLTAILDRPVYNYDTTQPIQEGNIPDIQTEINVLRVGPIELLTVPGELLPEVAIGGYDGSRIGTTYDPLISEDNPNPPDVSAAPGPPYLHDRMGGSYKWVVGMGNDELGYFVPPYDFKLDEEQPWFEEPEGDHYEETNSLGPNTVPLLEAEIDGVYAWIAESWG